MRVLTPGTATSSAQSATRSPQAIWGSSDGKRRRLTRKQGADKTELPAEMRSYATASVDLWPQPGSSLRTSSAQVSANPEGASDGVGSVGTSSAQVSEGDARLGTPWLREAPMDGICKEEVVKMHAEDFNVLRWPQGAPPFLRRRMAHELDLALREYKCEVCQKSWLAYGFDLHILHNATVLKRRLVCYRCQQDGYSPKDLQEYQCSRGHSAGHLKFDSKLLCDFKRGKSKTLTCKACRTLYEDRPIKTYKCDACQVRAPAASFNAHVLFNATSHGRKLVCLACQDLGYSPKDCKNHYCVKGHTCGHLKFTPQVLYESKRNSHTGPTCVSCKARVSKLLKTLRRKDAWKCECKNIPDCQKAYNALYVKCHEPRCPLTPTSAGEERWEARILGSRRTTCISCFMERVLIDQRQDDGPLRRVMPLPVPCSRRPSQSRLGYELCSRDDIGEGLFTFNL